MLLAFLSHTVKKTLSEPGVLFVLILQAAIIGFVAFGMSFEYHGTTLLSISLLGKEGFGGENLLVVRQMIEHFVQLGWGVFMFLVIIGTSPSFTELLRDPLLNILLTKKFSRTQLLLLRYFGIILVVGGLQLAFSSLMVLVLLLKTKIPFLWIISPLVAAPVMHFMTLAALAALLGILFEQPTAVTVVVLAAYFLSPVVSSAASLQDAWLRGAGYFFPPLASIDRYFFDTLLYRVQGLTPPFLSIFYAAFYLVLASVIFKKRDL